ncbi:hypothetical protein C8R44DRAFT_869384 [Mycena epipterygia]|nr:hypothetical protein C8R44DRAFT_869384 [Mycena epipterygia]
MQIRHCFVAGALLILPVLHVFAFPTSDVAAPQSLPSEFTALHPGLHPDEDTSNLDNLKGKFNSSLYYQAKPDAAIQGAGLMQLKHKYPTISLERSRFVSSVTCEPASDTMVVTFNDPKSFNTAVTDWSSHTTGFILITYVPGCGEGTDSSERSFHFVHNFDASEKDLHITCQIITVPIHHAIDNDKNILLHVATYRLDDPEGPSPRNVSQPEPVPEPPAHSVSSRAVGAPLQKRGWLSSIFDWASPEKIPLPPLTSTNAALTVAFTQITARPSIDAQLGTQNIVPWNSTYRGDPAYLLFSAQSGKKSFNLTCPRCGAQLSLFFRGVFEGTLAGGFTQANIAVNMDLDITLALGIEASYKVEGNKDFFTINAYIPGANIVIPGILEVGPAAGLTVGAGYNIDLNGYFTVGVTCGWKQVGGRVDFLNSQNSQLIGQWGLQTVCRKILDVGASATISLELYTKLAIKLRVAVLPKFTKKLTAEAALVEKLSFILSAAVATQAGTCPALVPYLSGTLQSSLYIAITGFSDIPLHTPLSWLLFGKCLTLGKGSVGVDHMIDAGNYDNGTIEAVKTGLAQQKLKYDFELGMPAAFVDFDNYVLDWVKSGTNYGDTFSRRMDSSYEYSGWRQFNSTIFATANGWALYLGLYTTFPDNNVLGTLFIADPEATTKWTGTFNELFAGTPPDSPYSVFVDDIKNATFYTVCCNYNNKATRGVFLTTISDPDKAVAAAISRDARGIVGNPATVTSCAMCYFHMFD